jgi:hypothetical protein
MKMADEYYEAEIKRLEQQVTDLKIALAQKTRDHEKSEIARHFERAMNKVNISYSAREDIMHRAISSGEWKLDSRGKLFRQLPSGVQVNQEGEYSSPDEYLETLKVTAPHLTGIPSQPTNSDDSAPNPWMKPSENLTRQGEIVKSNPARARQLAAAAGVTLNI